MDRILLIDKPAGMTSFDVVRKCRKIFHEKKIGHTGTLDPEASGLMIVLMGKYTKLLPFCVKDHKHYLAEFVLGIRTETEDIWGAAVDQREFREHDDEELRKTAEAFKEACDKAGVTQAGQITKMMQQFIDEMREKK